jgi:hypothetical protein
MIKLRLEGVRDISEGYAIGQNVMDGLDMK